MHYYSHHIGDFIKDTANLNDQQLATYLRMLWKYYLDEQPVGDDLEDVAFAMRSDEKTVRLLLRHYFVKTPEGWRHGRCDREISAFHEKSKNSQKAANARWKDAGAMRTHSERIADALVSDANQEPRTNNQEKSKALAAQAARRHRLPDEFYPNETGIQKTADARLSLDGELDRFRDYHRSKGSTMLDWQAAFRTWVSNAVKFGVKINGHENSRSARRENTIAQLTGRAAGATIEAG